MAITGSQKAYTFALSGVLRSGAGRSGYTGGGVFISVGGAALISSVKYDSLTITDSLDEVPNTCTFRLIDVLPTAGQEVIITLGSVNNFARLFAGHALTVTRVAGPRPMQHVYADVACVDYTWELGFLKVTKRYTNQSATAIAQDLITTYAAVNGFTSVGVAPSLPVLSEITFTNEDLPDALTRLARRIGAYWYVDYRKDVHLFFDETTNGTPTPLTPTHPTLAIDGFSYQADYTQGLTRVYVEGRGSTVLGAVAVGDTMIPLNAVDMFAAASDVFVKVSFQGADGAAQHLNFGGVVNVPGIGSLVGPGNGPPGAPTLALAPGAGLSTGTYQYAYTDVTPSGESLPSPLASITTGVVAAPSTSPWIQDVDGEVGGAVPAGGHAYAVTFTTAAGETTPGPDSNYWVAGHQSISNPTTVPTGSTPLDNVFGNLVESGLYQIKYAYATDAGVPPANVTLASPPSAVIRANTTPGSANDAAINVSIPCSPDPAVNSVWVYRTTNGGSTFYRGSRAVNVPGTFVNLGSTPSDATIVTQGTEPVANTTPRLSQVTIIDIPLGGPAVTGRKIYRKDTVSSPLRLLATLANNTTTTYVDALADAALGATAPTSNTAAASQVAIANIAPGPTPTTSRKLYRTAVNLSQLKLLTTIANNTASTHLDAAADAALGANAPTGDTSALQVPAGSVTAGSTTLPVANALPFPSSGGWVIIGNGEQVIRHTGKSATAITGIPATGVGAITAAVAYNSTITIAPMLTGIPTTGARALTRALTAGDEIYLVVQVDDTARQAQLAAAVGGNGIREEWVQDRRLSIGEARARGLATLNVRSLDLGTLGYRCRDLLTAAGKSIAVSLPAPLAILGTYKIQSVTIDNFRPYPNQYPTYTVTASASRFSFEDWLRKLRTRD